MRLLFFAVLGCISVLVSSSVLAQRQEALPAKVADYLKATDEEAAIPISDLEYEPNRTLVFGTFREAVGVGKLGWVSKIRVHQILDGGSARVALHWQSPVRYRVAGPNGKEFYKFGEVSEGNVILKSFPTSGMVDDATYKLDKVLEVTGTERYETAIAGTKTVFVVKPFEIEPYRRAFVEAVEARMKSVEDQKKAAEGAKIKAEELKRESDRAEPPRV